MHHMLEQTDSNNRTVRDNIKKIQIHGIGIKNKRRKYYATTFNRV